jgi:hypothetical protein
MNHQNPPDRDSGERLPRRDEVMAALGDAYARDELEMEELERRLDLAARASSSGDLLALLSDLDRRNLPVALGGSGAGSPARPEGSSGLAPSSDSDREGRSVALPGEIRSVDPARMAERQFEIAFLSGRVRKGSWVPARQITATAWLGSVELDFREVLVGSRVIDIFAMAVMGSVEVLVPPGVHVDTSGFALLGAFEEDSDLRTPPDPNAPTLRVRGFACMGSVEVIVRLPGETARDTRLRRKEERRRLKKARGD